MTEASVSINGSTIIGKRRPASAAYPQAIDVFYRIPYAEAPRFKLATPIEPNPSSTVDATDPGPVRNSPLEGISDPESPLRLHVFRPARPTLPSSTSSDSDLLPVAVYIHGGGFNFGSPLERDHASFVAWAAQGDGLVVVAVEYRLGPLGFSADQGLGEYNLGLKDQRVAVEWVKRWIGGFGGDAGRLTMMGVSAGAHSIGHHILASESPGFQRAILESGSATARSVLSATHARPSSQQQALTKAARGKPLTSLPVALLRSHGLSVWAANMTELTWPFQPVVEEPSGSGTGSTAISNTPLRLWEQKIAEGKGNEISVLTGFCSNEGIDFVPTGKNTNDDFVHFFKTLIPSLADDDLQDLQNLYPDPATDPSTPFKVSDTEAAKKGQQILRLSEAYAHYAYICPILHTADVLSRAGATVYVYEFAALSAPWRATPHASHGPCVSHDMAVLGKMPGMVSIAGEMASRWTKFAAGGDMPETDTEGEKAWWPRFRGGMDEGELLVFGKENAEMAGEKNEGVAVRKRTLTHREKEVCKFWWDRMELSQGVGERR
ncbi:carboxylesterase family protein [Sarocladium implicatum]|nr:carboxylesterase family protein [Sarocladium implicatum]